MLPTHLTTTALLCTLLLLQGCATNKAREEADRASVNLSGDGKRLVYTGKIKAEMVDKALALYQAADPKPDTLDISSQGGSLYDGIRLGTLVYKQQLDVRIFGECASSCANYIFTAGRRKFLLPNSRLLWHGGMLQPDWYARINQRYNTPGEKLAAQEEHDWLRKREAAYFRMIGVDPLITVCGQHPELRRAHPDAHGFDYSLEDMARFGVTGIQTLGRPWRAEVDGGDIFRASYCESAPPESSELLKNASKYADED
jgi:hypothetical protein